MATKFCRSIPFHDTQRTGVELQRYLLKKFDKSRVSVDVKPRRIPIGVRLMLELDDMIILLLGAPSKIPTLQDRLEGITRLEKLIFLLERESGYKDLIDEETEFHAYNFGPFSAQVYKAVDYLSAYGLLDDSAKLTPNDEDAWERIQVIDDVPSDPYIARIFTLTEDGREYYNALVAEIDSHGHDLDELSRFKERYGSLPLRQLIRYVYKQYPDTTTQSLIRDEVMRYG